MRMDRATVAQARPRQSQGWCVHPDARRPLQAELPRGDA